MRIIEIKDRSDWLLKRKIGLGGSDMSAIMGVNPWKTPLDIKLDKEMQLITESTSESMIFGNKLEPVVADTYAERFNKKLSTPVGLYQHDKYDIIVGTPDRLIDGERKGLEIKTSSISSIWGANNSSDIPEYYRIQCEWYMAIMDYDEWDLAVLINGHDFRVYNIKRDLNREKILIETAVNWWDKFIVNNEFPEIDGTKSYSNYINSKYSNYNPSNYIQVTEENKEINDYIINLINIKTNLKNIEIEKANYENKLKDLIKDYEGIDSQFAKISWKKSKDSVSIDWEKMCNDLLSKEIIDKNKDKYNIIKEGVRRFLITQK